MRRLALAILVALLTISASGVAALLVPEPCTSSQQQAPDDGACPPTCVTCGCCTHAVEPVVLSMTASPDDWLTEMSSIVPRIPGSRSREILHVPKLRAA
jgi:hypothetical protein